MMEEHIIFDNVSLADIMKDIYSNSAATQREIKKFIDKLAPLVSTVDDAVQIAPVIQQFIDTGVKNDDQLIKLAQIVQRIITSQAKNVGDDGFLSDGEKLTLLDNVKFQLTEMKKGSKELEDTVNDLAAKV